MRFTSIFTFVSLFISAMSTNNTCSDSSLTLQNNCVTFTIGSGTGCDWMCNYCANKLGTNNYYFPDGVCKYQEGGCVGNPSSGVTYTCCAV